MQVVSMHSFRGKQSWLERILDSPFKALVNAVYQLRAPNLHRRPDTVKVVCISDTHNTQPNVPPGDVLIHVDWLKSQPHAHKIFIAGNHDPALASRNRQKLNWDGLAYLQDSSTTIRLGNGRRLNIYGSPYTRKNGNWVFEYAATFSDCGFWTSKIPLETDILVTHMPPKFHLALDARGDESLYEELWRTRPLLHVFGHFHESRGEDSLIYDKFEVEHAAAKRGTGRWGSLFKMMIHLLLSQLRPPTNYGTRMVNVASIGGPRDQVQRPAIV
ncbi:hypothetical protein MMC30_005682 [Trapelia coarctata]|nr:hypothetical protein [Trapelia coarctata]